VTRPVGAITRGTTNPNRLRRVDNFIAYRCGGLLREAADPLVVDLGYGATPVTAVELRGRLATAIRADVAVVGLEIDPVRVEAARPYADPPRLEFRRGGFELAGLRPVVVRAFNVLRQYGEDEVVAAWRQMSHLGGRRRRRAPDADPLRPAVRSGPSGHVRRAAAQGPDPPQRRGRAGPRVAARGGPGLGDRGDPVRPAAALAGDLPPAARRGAGGAGRAGPMGTRRVDRAVAGPGPGTGRETGRADPPQRTGPTPGGE